MYAQKFGQDTPIPSMQLCIENVDQAGGCAYGYSCVYTDSISWASPTEPLPMIRDPRVAFEQLFGVGGTRPSARRAAATDGASSTSSRREMSSLKRDSAPPTAAPRPVPRDIREIERRIQQVERATPAARQRALPGAPSGVPDSFAEHVKLMFDLQVLAFAVRHHARLLVQDGPRRLQPHVPRERRRTTGFHPASHHGATRARVPRVRQINKYHVSLLPYFLDKLKSTTDGDSNLLDKTLIIYGSPMGDSQRAQPPSAARSSCSAAATAAAGNVHIKAPDGTPMANAMLSHDAQARHGRPGGWPHRARRSPTR
jgi:hypothetical protein